MANKETIKGHPNLQKLTTTQARQIGKKGGSVCSLNKQLAQRKYCNSKCPISDKCWAKHISINRREQEIAAEFKRIRGLKISENVRSKLETKARKIEARCALKEMPSRNLNRTLKLLEDGEAGFDEMIVENILRLGSEIDMAPTKKNFKLFLKELREGKKAIYGDRRRVEANVHDDRITAGMFEAAYNAAVEEAASGDDSDPEDPEEAS